MASPSACWRCTGRALLQSSTRSRSASTSRLPRTSIVTTTRSLHTTPPFSAGAQGKGQNQRKPVVPRPLNLSSKKKNVRAPPKKPEVGYRRALRKAIILSNSNAPNLDLPELTAELLSDTESIGKVFSINVEDLEKLRSLEAFQKRQMWQFFYRPTTFIRNESVGLARAMESVERFAGEEVEGTNEGSEVIGEANLAGTEEGIAEAELAAMEAREDGIIAKLSVQLEKLKDEIVAVDLQMENMIAGHETEEEMEELKRLDQHKERLEREARGIIPLLKYHENLEKRKIERSQKPARPETFEEYEALLSKQSKQLEEFRLQKEESVAAKKEVQDTTSRQAANYIITGKAGTGKSILLLQAIVTAIRRKWLVMTIPNAHDVVIGTTSYEINPETGRYVQRDYISKMLGKIGKANSEILLEAKVKDAVQIGNTDIAAGESLMMIVDAGSSSSEHSYEAFVALLAELEKPGAPPVLFTLDNLDYALRQESGYKTPEFEELYPPRLEVLHTFFEYLSGRRKFARQMVIGVTTTELHSNPSLDLTLQGKPLPGIGKYDHNLPLTLGTLARTINLKGLNREHTKRLLEFYKLAGLWDYSWDRSVPILPALEKAGVTEEDYRDFVKKLYRPGEERTIAEQIEEGIAESEEGGETADPKITMSELQETLAMGQAEKEKEQSRGFELRRLLQALKEKPLTEHEVTERYVLTGGVPRQLMKLCLRLQGGLLM
ncbi:37S ribosomal protein S23 mitochondrial [Orbilia ellipsospora]|uniref:Small ribosomal subunit protein mS29 n=1 Tax=Orbilia ellipsospora TaxID=2528407 RepID=A0AAV9XE15_9PEZI